MIWVKGGEITEEFEKLLNGVAALESIATADACTLSVKEDRKVSLSEITNA
ncbi:Gfo/Idh/MocA family oxidoreductase [Streptococcus pneumoniae]|nr:Gfo/Idh/MocA family oxidoreductase [Streptococcus pneumoniae]VRR60733.1 Gfo/Idh/MocA family oxidoreductase [Streptococcus pneumoniae]